jgi:hypothetical protein
MALMTFPLIDCGSKPPVPASTGGSSEKAHPADYRYANR